MHCVGLPIEDWREGGAAIGRLPDPAAGRGDVERVRLALHDREVHDPPAHVGRTDAAGL